MKTAKLFKNGRSQAVRLPKEFRMEGDEVKISREGKKIILEPFDSSWDKFFKGLSMFSDDFMAEGRQQPPMPPDRVHFD